MEEVNKMGKQLDGETLKHILQNENMEELSFSKISRLVQEEEGISGFIPDGICRIDPRNGLYGPHQ